MYRRLSRDNRIRSDCTTDVSEHANHIGISIEPRGRKNLSQFRRAELIQRAIGVAESRLPLRAAHIGIRVSIFEPLLPKLLNLSALSLLDRWTDLFDEFRCGGLRKIELLSNFGELPHRGFRNGKAFGELRAAEVVAAFRRSERAAFILSFWRFIGIIALAKPLQLRRFASLIAVSRLNRLLGGLSGIRSAFIRRRRSAVR